MSGVLVTDGGRSYIGVQKTEAPQRRRFTVGHEIGHYFLKHPNGTEVHMSTPAKAPITFRAVRGHRTTRSAHGSDPREVEANQRSAACLLMPGRLVRRQRRRTLTEGTLADRNIQTLAKRFLVREAAMTNRLQALGLLPLV